MIYLTIRKSMCEIEINNAIYILKNIEYIHWELMFHY